MPSPSVVTRATLCVVALSLGMGAAWAELRTNGGPAVIGTTLVGGAFVCAALASGVGSHLLWLVATPGLLWWAGSLVPALGQAYIWGLVLLFVVAQHGRVAGLLWLPVIAGIPAWLGVLDRWMVALLMAVAALSALLTSTGARPIRLWCVASAGTMSVVTAGTHLLDITSPGMLSPQLASDVLTLTLTMIGAAALVVFRQVLAQTAGSMTAILAPGHEPSVGMAEFRDVLRSTLGDAELDIVWHEAGTPAPAPPHGRAVLTVDCGSDGAAHIVHRASTLRDAAVRASLSRGVELTVRHTALRRGLAEQVSETRAARLRVLAAGDRQRADVAGRLATGVIPSLDAALDALQDVEGADADTVAEIVRAARSEVLDVVSGVPASLLGADGLPTALRVRVAGFTVPVAIDETRWTPGSSVIDEALFYVCSEAVVNAIKHAEPGRITVTLSRDAAGATAVIEDDGSGGADPTGHGLTGLADRVSTHGGVLTVRSPRGEGTTITVHFPSLTRSSTRDGTSTAGTRRRLAPHA